MAGADPHAVAAEDLPALRLPYADGLIAIRRVHQSPDSAVCQVRPDDPADGRLVTWVDFVAADPVSAAGTAAGLLRAGDLTAVAVHARYAPAVATALAVCLAGRIHDARLARGLTARIVTSDHRPELGRPELGRPERRRPELGRPELGRPEPRGSELWRPGLRRARAAGPGGETGLVRVPHIVAVHDSVGAPSGPEGGPDRSEGVTDRVVWEIMTGDQYDAWLGESPGPDRDVLERHLGGLLVLARLVRAPGSHIPHRDAVVHALAGGPLTTEAVHRDPGPLLAAAAAVQRREP